MRAQRPNELGKAIERFFREYLPTLRGASLHTIRNYRDALVLFLRFVSAKKRRPIEDLDIGDFAAEQVRGFLAFLEAERHNGIATRNARLAALHTFARFLATEQPAHLAELQRVLGVPNAAPRTRRSNTSSLRRSTRSSSPLIVRRHQESATMPCSR